MIKKTTVNKRNQELKEYILSFKNSVCIERLEIYSRELEKTDGASNIVHRARSFSEYLAEKTIYINKQDLLVGSTASKPLAASIFPEYSVDWIMDELKSFPKRPRHKFQVENTHFGRIKELCRKWIGRTHYDRVDSSLSLLLGDKMQYGMEKEKRYPHINQVLTIEHNQNGDGHIIPDYDKLMEAGIAGVLDEISAAEALLDYDDVNALDRKNFLLAAKISMKAASNYILRHEELALALAEEEQDAERKEELVSIAEVCRKISTDAPDSFQEAIQLVLFMHLLIQIESNGHSISLGRMDQYLYPFYLKSMDKGGFSEADAQELIEQFLLKCYEANKLRDWGTTEILGGNQLFQTISLGGQYRDRKDGVNDLSYLFLNALGNTNLNIPTVVVSINNNTPLRFLEASLESLKRHKGGMPAFFNDDVAIQSLLNVGIPVEDARTWAGMGCSEVRVPGKHATGLTPVYINLLKILEMTLYNGLNPKTGLHYHVGKKRVEECENIEDLIELFREQLAHYLGYIPAVEKSIAESYFTLTPTPFLSSIVDYRIEMGKDISWGRGKNYNDTIIHAHGFPNVANCLSAINTLVFELSKYTISEIVEGMKNNYAMKKFGVMRNAMLDAPKFGNDEEDVDDLCNRIFTIFASEMNKYKPLRGGGFGSTGQTVVMNVQDGEVIGATPDGRLASEPIADNMSPVPGTDKNGITSIFNSLSRIDHSLMDNGSILNLKFHPSLLASSEKTRIMAQAIKTYFRTGGFQVQLNVVDRETLLAAQENPEDFSNLIVKVAGFSSYFVELERKWQDQLISRTEYSL